jgi:hypothetical protein
MLWGEEQGEQEAAGEDHHAGGEAVGVVREGCGLPDGRLRRNPRDAGRLGRVRIRGRASSRRARRQRRSPDRARRVRSVQDRCVPGTGEVRPRRRGDANTKSANDTRSCLPVLHERSN